MLFFRFKIPLIVEFPLTSSVEDGLLVPIPTFPDARIVIRSSGTPSTPPVFDVQKDNIPNPSAELLVPSCLHSILATSPPPLLLSSRYIPILPFEEVLISPVDSPLCNRKTSEAEPIESLSTMCRGACGLDVPIPTLPFDDRIIISFLDAFLPLNTNPSSVLLLVPLKYPISP